MRKVQLLTPENYTQVYRKLSKSQREILPNAKQFRQLSEASKMEVIDAYNAFRMTYKPGDRLIHDSGPVAEEIAQTLKIESLTPEQRAKAVTTWYKWQSINDSDVYEQLSMQGSNIRSRTRDKEWYSIAHYTSGEGTEDFDIEKLTTEQIKSILSEAENGTMKVDDSIRELLNEELEKKGVEMNNDHVQERMETINIIENVIDSYKELVALGF